MAKRASKEELLAKRISKQIIKHESLLKLLETFGFQYRRAGGGSSHIRVWHPDYPEIRHFGVIAGTKKTGSQRYAIDACLQIIEWEERAKDAGLKVVPQAAEEFETAAATNEIIIPEAFELVQGRNNPGKFLRHRRLPQIATELIGDISQENIDASVEYLDERAQKLDNILDIAVEEYDFEKSIYPNGTITLMHPAYIRGLVFYPFTPRLSNWTVISEIEEAIEAAELAKINSAQSLEDVVNYYGLSEQKSTSNTHRTFLLSNPFFDNVRANISLPVTPHGHFSSPDFMKFVQDIEQQLFQGLHKHIKSRFGFNFTKVIDGKIKASHILYDIEFEIDVSDFDAPYVDSDFYDEYFSADAKDQDKKVKAFIEILDRNKLRHNTISVAIQEFSSRLNHAMARINAIIPNKNDRLPGSKHTDGTIGKINFRLNGQLHLLDVLFVRSRDNVRQFVPTDETLETLETIQNAQNNRPFTVENFALRIAQDPNSTLNPIDDKLPLPPTILFGPK